MAGKIIFFEDGSGVLGTWKYDADFKDWSFQPRYTNIDEDQMKWALKELKRLKKK